MSGYAWHINNQKNARQLNLFDGTTTKGIGAMDVDGLIEYKNKGYILYEVKHGDGKMPIGQRLALERMVRDFTSIGKIAVAMVVTHNVDNPEIPVSIGDCTVRELYYGKEAIWRAPKRKITARELSDIFIDMFNAHELKI